MNGRRVLIAGSTGLVGREVLARLLVDDSVVAITALVRRMGPGGATPPKLRREVVAYDRLSESADLFGVDQVVSALGTTIRAAGSQAAFRRVDLTFPLALARLARNQGARHFLLVSAIGADPASRIFYNRVKGELEEAVLSLGYPSVTIVRPSLLLGERAEFRLGEEIARRLSVLTPRRWKPVHAGQVAAALVAAAQADTSGNRIIENQELLAFAR